MEKASFRLLSIFLIISCLVLAFPAFVSADVQGDFVYTISEGTAILTDYTGHSATVVIPDTLGG